MASTSQTLYIKNDLISIDIEKKWGKYMSMHDLHNKIYSPIFGTGNIDISDICSPKIRHKAISNICPSITNIKSKVVSPSWTFIS